MIESLWTTSNSRAEQALSDHSLLVACAAPERIKELQNPSPPRLEEIVYQHTDLGRHTTKVALGGSVQYF